MNYGTIKNLDIANGPGVRVSLFVSGCDNHCKGCFQPETWDCGYGKEFTNDTEKHLLDMVDFDHIEGLTLLGGDPLYHKNYERIDTLLTRFRERFGFSKNVWLYTGYEIDSFYEDVRYNTPTIISIYNKIDWLVDGKFEESLKDPTLQYRGSSNQHLIKMSLFDPSKGIVYGFDKYNDRLPSDVWYIKKI